jgi:hypothetical protein
MILMFLYIRDPLFLSSCLLYACNQFLLKPLLPNEELFFHGYFNDLLLIPCALPPLLLIHQYLSIRGSNELPSFQEVLTHLIIWSLLFEWIGPILIATATSDLGDIFSYWAGGMVSWMLWNKRSILPKTWFTNPNTADGIERVG